MGQLPKLNRENEDQRVTKHSYDIVMEYIKRSGNALFNDKPTSLGRLRTKLGDDRTVFAQRIPLSQ